MSCAPPWWFPPVSFKIAPIGNLRVYIKNFDVCEDSYCSVCSIYILGMPLGKTSHTVVLLFFILCLLQHTFTYWATFGLG